MYYSAIFIISAFEESFNLFKEQYETHETYETHKKKAVRNLIVSFLNIFLIILIYMIFIRYDIFNYDIFKIEEIVGVEMIQLVFSGFKMMLIYFIPLYIFSKIFFYKKEIFAHDVQMRTVSLIILSFIMIFTLVFTIYNEITE